MPASTIKAFYKRWYRPENMAVVIAGDFDPAAVEKLLKAAMSACRWKSEGSSTPVPRLELVLYRLVELMQECYTVRTSQDNFFSGFLASRMEACS